jgi:uncharacterized membrane protein YphA (DoxX/SURF4 family)
MSERALMGTVPWLPWPLSTSPWWTQPVRAERLAALRIGVAAVLLVDILGMYLPQATDFFGAWSLGSPEVFADRTAWPHWRWSLLEGMADPRWVQGVLWVWAALAVCLLLGICPRLSAAGCWALSVSVLNANYYLHNAGDNVRTICLFYLMLSPCGAAWSVASCLRRRSRSGPVCIPPWPLCLLLLQLSVIYFFNGVHKAFGEDWRSGQVLHYVIGNLGWTRFAYSQVPLPEALLPLLAYLVLVWELTFPLLMLLPATRKPALWMGVLFHLGTAVLLQLVMFPGYMLCLYLPLVPWERYFGEPSRPAASANGW